MSVKTPIEPWWKDKELKTAVDAAQRMGYAKCGLDCCNQIAGHSGTHALIGPSKELVAQVRAALEAATDECC